MGTLFALLIFFGVLLAVGDLAHRIHRRIYGDSKKPRPNGTAVAGKIAVVTLVLWVCVIAVSLWLHSDADLERYAPWLAGISTALAAAVTLGCTSDLDEGHEEIAEVLTREREHRNGNSS